MPIKTLAVPPYNDHFFQKLRVRFFKNFPYTKVVLIGTRDGISPFTLVEHLLCTGSRDLLTSVDSYNRSANQCAIKRSRDLGFAVRIKAQPVYDEIYVANTIAPKMQLFSDAGVHVMIILP